MSVDPGPDDHRPRGLGFVCDVLNGPPTAAAWSAAATAHGGRELGGRDVVEDRLAAAVRTLRGIFATPDAETAAGRLNAVLAAPPLPVALARTDDGRWALRPAVPADADAASSLLAIGAFALAERLSDRGRCAWGVCAASDCDRVFVDEGRRRPQRFCTERCATRTRVAAHRARSAAPAPDAATPAGG
ncbi:CGNR zinc finger domain-containing protein [Patulibacter sp. SYSU D01012]|uniref:CGNR zinc finger domain-containing protein n=1 Tax=Patulibacter sp. SYSU D01012 TaxID=2817381 RepID=UPI001B300787|nr:CGNR zinc finger domain-containing protein [Patulibacter sp. SYSU D01012]